MVAFLALGIGLLARRWDLGAAEGDLEAAARDYRAAGLPWTAADLARPLPKASDAAPLILKALDAMPGRAHLTLDARSADLDRCAPALRLAHAAAKRPAADFRVDYDRGLGVKFRFASSGAADGLTLAFAARAARRATGGDDAGALADLEDARRLAGLVGSEPSVMGVLSGGACARNALSGAERCLAAAAANPVRLARYRAWIAAPLPRPDAARAWRGEVYQAVAIARNLSREQLAGFLLPGLGIDPWRAAPVRPLRRTGLPEDPVARAFLARCLRLNAELARATHGLSDPPARVTEAAQAIRRRAARDDGLSHALDDLLFVPLTLGGMQTQNEARRVVLLALADALAIHAKTARWPTELAPPDPYAQGPLRCRLEGEGFRIWSVGPNGKDDGGWTRLKSHHVVVRLDDIVAAYPPAPR